MGLIAWGGIVVVVGLGVYVAVFRPRQLRWGATDKEVSRPMPGDEIVAINGYDVSRLNLEQITQLLTQSRQQQAHLIVRRPGEGRILPFTLTPEDMQSSSVDRAFFIGAGIGYIRVSSFDGNTGREIKAAIEKLGGQSLVGLVLDLRNNPGGLLDQAVRVADLFLRKPPPAAEPGQEKADEEEEWE